MAKESIFAKHKISFLNLKNIIIANIVVVKGIPRRYLQKIGINFVTSNL